MSLEKGKSRFKFQNQVPFILTASCWLSALWANPLPNGMTALMGNGFFRENGAVSVH